MSKPRFYIFYRTAESGAMTTRVTDYGDRNASPLSVANNFLRVSQIQGLNWIAIFDDERKSLWSWSVEAVDVPQYRLVT